MSSQAMEENSHVSVWVKMEGLLQLLLEECVKFDLYINF